MALLILTSNESVGVSSGTYTVVGTRDGKETVTVAPGAKVTLDASFNAGGDSIAVSGNAGSYKAVSDGTQVILTDALGGTVTIPVGTTKSTVAFADASRDLVISGGALKLGNDTVGTTATTVTAGTGGTTPVVGQTFTLTAGANSIVGTAADDFIDGSLVSGSQTLNSFDTINGGAGNDILFANVITGSTVSPKISGVEAVTFSSGKAGSTVDLIGSSGYTSLENNGSSESLLITNIASTASAAKISNVTHSSTTSTATTFQWVASAVVGSNDSIGLTLSNVAGAAPVTIAGVETVNVASQDGPNSVAFGNVGARTIVATGNQTLSLGVLNNSTLSLDASAATAGVSATFGQPTGSPTVTVTGGVGNDSFDVSRTEIGKFTVSTGAGNDTIIGGAIAVGDTIDGGSGAADVLVVTSGSTGGATGLVPFAATTPSTFAVTNVEQITVIDGLAASINLNNVGTGIDTLNLSAVSAGGTNVSNGASVNAAALDTASITVSTAASAFTVNLGGTPTAGTANTAALAGPVTFTSTGTGTTDSLAINNRGSSGSGSLNTFAGSAITSNGFEAVTVSSGTSTVGTGAQTLGTLTITPTATTAPLSLTVSGANALTVGLSAPTSTALATVSAANLTAQTSGTGASRVTTFTLSSAGLGTGGTLSVTGSAGDDNLTIGNFASTIDGGAGADSIVGGSAADSILGGNGADTITGTSGNDTISGGDGNDSITVGAGNVSVSGGAGDDSFVVGSTLTSGDTIEGGDGTDTLSVTASPGLSGTAFAGVSNVERVALTGTTAISLSAPLASSGTTFDLSSTDLNDLTFASGYTGAVTITETGLSKNAGTADKITNSANVALTLSGSLADITNVALTGGTGVDTVVITADNTTGTLGAMSRVDAVTMVAGTATASGSTVGAQPAVISVAPVTASGVTLTVDASAMTNSNATFGFNTSATGSNAGSAVVTGATTAINTINLSNFAGGVTVTGGSNNDIITAGSGNDSLSGGGGGDSYIMGANLNASDVISDSAGTDALSATINGLTATTGALRITGVETLNLSTSGAASTISAAAISGTTRINVAAGSESQNLTLTNLAAGTNLGLGNAANTGLSLDANGTYTGTVTFGLADATGSSDAVTVTLNNTTSSAATAGINAKLVAASGIETVTISSNTTAITTNSVLSTTTAIGNAALDVSGLVVPALVISGGAAANGSATTPNAALAARVLSLTGAEAANTTKLSTSTTSVNANGYASSLRLATSDTATAVTISGSGTADNITGGTGNDTFTITSTGYTDATALISTATPTAIAYAIAGGSGTDTLNLSVGSFSSTVTTATLSLANVSEVENFNITIPSSVGTTVTDVTGLNRADTANIVFTGGNSLSTLTVTAAAVGSGGNNFKSFDASGVTGPVTLLAAPGAMNQATDTIRGGSGSSDVLRVSFAGVGSTATVAPVISGFESMFVTAGTNDNAVQSFASTTGLSTITVGGTNSFTASGLAAGVALTVGQSSTASNTVGAFSGSQIAFGQAAAVTNPTVATDTQTVNLVRGGTVTLALPGVETINLNESSTVAATSFTLSVDTNIAGVANANPVTINLAGGIAGTQTDTAGASTTVRNVTFASGGLQTNVAVLNAGSFVSGALIMGSGSRVGTTAMTVTGGGGNDTIIMRSNNDVLTAGAGTDTLQVVANVVSGGISIDLNNAQDQVQLGFSAGGAQTGFEIVDLGGVTGNLGAEVLGRNSAVNLITGTVNADNLIGGSSSDTIIGGTGGDTINVVSGSDRVQYTVAGQSFSDNTVSGSLANGVNGNLISGADLISGMGPGDIIDISSITGTSTATGFNIAVGRTTGLTGNSSAVAELFGITRGAYTGTGLWSFSATGPDLLLQWDNNGSTSNGIESVVLVGAAGTGTTSAVTGITANSAGLILLV